MTDDPMPIQMRVPVRRKWWQFWKPAIVGTELHELDFSRRERETL